MVTDQNVEDIVDLPHEESEALERSGTESQLMKVILRRQLGFLGHVMRGQGFEKFCLTGKIEGV